MSEQKGFTLIEVLAILAILALIVITTFPAVSGAINRSKERTYESQVKLIEDAASGYVSENVKQLFPNNEEVAYVSLSDLKASRVVKNKKVIDPKTGNAMNGCVKVSKDSYGQYKVKYYEKTCKELENSELKPIITVPLDADVVTKQKKVVISYTNADDDYINQYSLDNGKSWIATENNSITLTLYRNTNVMTRVLDKTSNTVFGTNTKKVDNFYDIYIELGNLTANYFIGTDQTIPNDYNYAAETGTKKCVINGTNNEINNINMLTYGSYTIECSISNSYGETSSDSQVITIRSKPSGGGGGGGA